jgi:uncharacterized protein
MMKTNMRDGWNPYLAGALVGLLAILSVAFTGQFLGASTTFVRAAAAVEQTVAPERVQSNEYYQKNKPRIDWQGMVLIGVFAGAALASLTDRSFKSESVPPMWAERFGNNLWKRGGVAFIGGIFAMFGARLADGCPSGHGLSGLMQLSVSGFVSLVFFFAGGLIVANLIVYRRAKS